MIRSWAKRAASSYFGETHLIFPMAENKIWGLPCAVLPKKCPIRISRKSFLSQLFNKKFAVSESMSYPVWLSHEDAEIQYPPVYPSKGGSLLTSGVSPVFGHTHGTSKKWGFSEDLGGKTLLMVYHHFPDEHHNIYHNCIKCCRYIHYVQADPIFRSLKNGEMGQRAAHPSRVAFWVSSAVAFGKVSTISRASRWQFGAMTPS